MCWQDGRARGALMAPLVVALYPGGMLLQVSTKIWPGMNQDDDSNVSHSKSCLHHFG